jgi:DNA-binding CsgD family transcriptional regulator
MGRKGLTALDQTFFDLFDCVADLNGRGKADLFLREAISRYGLRHIAYTAINVPEPNLGPFYVICTYPQQWVERYIERNYVVLDPVVRKSFTTITPFDWDDLPKKAPAVKNFFGESVEFGLGRRGITFPVRGNRNEIGSFSINSEASSREWLALRKFLIRDFQVLAILFHDGVLRQGRTIGATQSDKLSVRETECLKWAAEGKTVWETSLILGISERCVRFHLDQARRKLDCLTKVQAVAKSIAAGLVTLP